MTFLYIVIPRPKYSFKKAWCCSSLTSHMYSFYYSRHKWKYIWQPRNIFRTARWTIPAGRYFNGFFCCILAGILIKMEKIKRFINIRYKAIQNVLPTVLNMIVMSLSWHAIRLNSPAFWGTENRRLTHSLKSINMGKELSV